MSKEKKPQVVKRPYASPVIDVYGNIRSITKSFGKTGKADGKTTGNAKFTAA